MAKKIVVIGASGLIGSTVAKHLEEAGHTVIRASRSAGEQVDMTDFASVQALFERVGAVDAVVCCSGVAPFKPLNELTSEDFMSGFGNKTIGQINVALAALKHLKDKGSITLTTGILAQEAIPTAAASAAANGALESFIYTAAAEADRGIRLNAVSPTVLKEASGYHSAFPGFAQVPADEVAQAFVRSVEGIESGKIFRIWK